MIIKIRNRILVFLIFTAIILGVFYLLIPSYSDHIMEFSYFEDKDGKYDIEDIKTLGKEWFTQSEKRRITAGQSDSVWWVHILPEEEDLFLTISNPTVEFLDLYLIDNETGSIENYKSGWGYSSLKKDNNFIYPVFETTQGKEIYLKLNSSYIQSYQFRLLEAEDFNKIRDLTVISIGIFTGFLLAVAGIHFSQYLKLKEKTNIYFILHITTMILYQFSLLGFYRIIFHNMGDFLISRVDLFGALSVATTVFFADSFLKDTSQKRNSKRLMIYSIAFMTIIIINTILGSEKNGNFLSVIFAYTTAIVILILSLKAAKDDFERIKYFLLGYAVLVTGIGIFSLRLAGIIPNNEFTLFAILFTHVVETILFSSGVAEKYKYYQKLSELNELAFLKAQIKPHFLYNTLNVLAAMAIKDNIKTRELLLDFSEYLRYSFDTKKDETMVSLKEEIKAIEAYVRIQQARFPDSIEVIYDFDDKDAELIKVPQFIIQPLVENSIQHGLRKLSVPGWVKVKIRDEKNGVRISVSDNGSGLTGEQIENILKGTRSSGTGVGLHNIQKRLKVLFDSELEIESTPGKETIFSFLLPY